MRAFRAVLAVGGVVMAVVGVLKLLEQDSPLLVNIAVWLAGGVIVHDAVLAPIAIIVGAAAVRVIPSWARMPVAAGFVVLGTVTVLAIPFLGRFGEASDNATLLPRNYTAGWLVLVALTLAVVVVAAWWQRRAEPAGPAVVPEPDESDARSERAS